ncbi:MAG: SpoIIE family protein phosphatase [Acidobacteriaceae bacterium]
MRPGNARHRSYRLIWLVLLLSAMQLPVHAQTFNLTTGREPVASLDGLWHFHTGDNPAWASPGFDDSQWPLIRSGESWTEQGVPAFNGYAWYRFKVQVPGDGRPVDLLLTEIVSGYQVYADGRLIGSAGAAVATRDPVFAAQPAAFTLPSVAGGPKSIQIAVRVWTYRPIASWYGAGSTETGNEAGDPALLVRHTQFSRALRTLDFGNEYAFGLFAAMIGLAILALFLLRPGDKEYLWFSILLLAQSAGAAVHLMMNLGSLPWPLWYALAITFRTAELVAALSFFSIVLRARRSAMWWIVCLLLAGGPVAAALVYLQWAQVGAAFALDGICTLPTYLWVIAMLLRGAIRKDVSARLLLVPVTLAYGFNCVGRTARIVWQLGGSSNEFSWLNPTLFQWPFPTGLAGLIGYIFFLALLVFLVRRFSLARKEEERLAAEFEAARTIQSLLIPAAPPATPGFQVENVYLPAAEVGGDFFQVAPGEDGSLLVVVGDVSGKGLKAAMTVSAIVGALRDSEDRQPARVLAHLNRVLRGQSGGFVTCSVALIADDGGMTIATAGHLPPYRNGEEMPVPSGLPLGIVTEASYEERRFALAPGDRLTFLSDGVVEARNAAGELFGFERTRQISLQPAEQIAQAAQAHGQEDDITVVTLRFAPAIALHA